MPRPIPKPVRACMAPEDIERWQIRVCSSCQYGTQLDDEGRCPRMLLRVYVNYVSDLGKHRVECVNYETKNDIDNG